MFKDVEKKEYTWQILLIYTDQIITKLNKKR